MIQDEAKPKKRGRPKKPSLILIKNTSGKPLHGYNNDLIQPGETYRFPKKLAEMLINRKQAELVDETSNSKS